jgi:nucleoside-diphosphate-sugar epimerase
LIIGSGGYIGAACASAMRAAGHEVSGLARDAGVAARLQGDGYGVLPGDLSDIGRLARDILEFDAVLYTPRVTFAEEKVALMPLVEALEGTGKAFIFVTGTGVMSVNARQGEWRPEVFTETDTFVPLPWIQQRVDVENRFLSAAERGVRAILLRPPHVWGYGGSTLVRGLVECYRRRGDVCYVGYGLHPYAHVHVDDLGELSRLVLERGVAGGVYNAVGGETNFRTMARATAQLLGCEARSVDIEESKAIWGDWVGPNLYATSCPARGPQARALGWTPKHIDIEVDVLGGGYDEAELGESFDAATRRRLGAVATSSVTAG